MSSLREQYHEEIVECLVRYGHMSEDEAEALLERWGLLANVKEDSVVFHEYPYFWAMNLMHGSEEPEWFRDPKLWPPPQDYLDLVKRRHKKT